MGKSLYVMALWSLLGGADYLWPFLGGIVLCCSAKVGLRPNARVSLTDREFFAAAICNGYPVNRFGSDAAVLGGC